MSLSLPLPPPPSSKTKAHFPVPARPPGITKNHFPTHFGSEPPLPPPFGRTLESSCDTHPYLFNHCTSASHLYPETWSYLQPHKIYSIHTATATSSAMSKRSWQDANLPSPRSAPSIQQNHNISVSPHSYSSPNQASPKKNRTSFDEPLPIAKAPPKIQRTNSTTNGAPGPGAAQDSGKMPGISRKVKACAACRKQKVSCANLPHSIPVLTTSIDQVHHGGRPSVSEM